MPSAPTKAEQDFSADLNCAHEASQAESLQTFKVGITVMREPTQKVDGKMLILPSGLSQKHYEVIKAALEAEYSTSDMETFEMGDHSVWRSDLTRWNVKYFDMALEWHLHKKLVFKTNPNHLHFDEIAKRIRYLQFARDLGLDSMCVELYRQLGEEVGYTRSGYDKYLVGYFVRKLLRQSYCLFIHDDGCSLAKVIYHDREIVEEDQKQAQQDLVLVKEKLTKQNEEEKTLSKNEKPTLETRELKRQKTSLEGRIKGLTRVLSKLQKEKNHC